MRLPAPQRADATASTGLFSAWMAVSFCCLVQGLPLVAEALTYSAQALSCLRSDGATKSFPVSGNSLFNRAAFLLRIVDANVSGMRRTPINEATARDSAILRHSLAAVQGWEEKSNQAKAYSPQDGPPPERSAHVTSHNGGSQGANERCCRPSNSNDVSLRAKKRKTPEKKNPKSPKLTTTS